jgi:hypothetical protein
LCKTVGLIQILIYFYKGTAVDRVHRLWTTQGWPVHGSIVDLTMAGGQSSPKLGLAVALRHGGLPWRHQRQEGGAGTLAVEQSKAQWWCSVREVLEERRVGGVVWRGGGGGCLI